MHRTRRPNRLQISSETIRVLRGRELGRAGGAVGYKITIVETDGDCSVIHEPTSTYGDDCKGTSHP